MTDGPRESITVLGAGSWGTALAILLARNGRHHVHLWGRDAAHVAQMQQAGCNQRYLPGTGFPATLTVTHDLATAIRQSRDILIVVPSHGFRAILQSIKPHLQLAARIAWATKGLEHGSHKLLHQVVAEELGPQTPAAVISGPTFAREVALNLPTAVTVASTNTAFASQLAEWLHGGHFRAYTSEDVVGVEVGGATKNALAIAAGITDGLGFGANTRAALISRGLAEMMRLGVALGGRQETFMGLAGLGDLVLTCTDDQSRNRRLGIALGQGKSLEQARAGIPQVVEGIETAQEIYRLAQELGVEMPIVEQVYRVLYQGCPPREAVRALLEREQKAEQS
ncbi:MAG: glycerol-3-phosphate dehydrogenase [Gammaproteobacteria bacterium RBG_16_57_12]|nr:MAG: glycerol-3-phosphate dehydrogenase [Gammaproteobacteria bacterium RBG_16_57_12]